MRLILAALEPFNHVPSVIDLLVKHLLALEGLDA